jgi:hypothetical protein
MGTALRRLYICARFTVGGGMRRRNFRGRYANGQFGDFRSDLAAYDRAGIQSFQGQALYLDPTLHVRFNGHMMLAVAWAPQIAGHATGENFGLDLTNFPHQQGNLKFEIEF